MTVLVSDIETNGYTPNTIWVCTIVDFHTDECKSYYGDAVAEGLVRLAEADYVVGHNFRQYDAKVIHDLTEGLVTIQPERIIDTLELSRSLFPDRPKHSLSFWGEVLGYPKLIFNEFQTFSPRMVEYCERDTKLNKLLFDFFLQYMREAGTTA